MGWPEQKGTGSRKSAECFSGGLQQKIFRGSTAVKGAGVGSCNCAAGYRMQGTAPYIWGRQQTGSRKSSAGIWGGLWSKKKLLT